MNEANTRGTSRLGMGAGSLIVPLICNSYAAIGKEGVAFLGVLRMCAQRRFGSPGRPIEPFLQSIVTYFTAQNAIAAYGKCGGTSGVVSV